MLKKYLKHFDEMEYAVKFYKSFSTKEWNKFLKLYENIFRRIEQNVFQWYFQWNNVFAILSEKKGEAFGIYSLLKIDLFIDNRVIDGYLCHNVGIQKAYGGKGFFQFIADKTLTKVLNTDNIALGFPNKASRKGHFRLGWEEIGAMQFISYSVKNREKISLNKEYVFEEFGSFPKEIEPFLQNHSSKFSLRVHKSRDFLNWRISKPSTKYNLYLVRKSKKIVGYLVLKAYEENNEKRLHLVDFLFEDNDTLQAIINFSINEYVNGNYDILNTWSSIHSFVEDIFMENYFEIQKNILNYPVILFQKEKKYDFTSVNKEKIFFTLFDNDVF